EERKKKLIAGIVLTGGGSQLKHLKQLVEYITGMDTRLGFPNEHLAGDSNNEVVSPVYATGVGLLMTALKTQYKSTTPREEEEALVMVDEPQEHTEEKASGSVKLRKSIFEKWSEKLKDFLDNAE
ncbi:MAG: cell division protein FtsA, partial [Bacteroidota bacterium]